MRFLIQTFGCKSNQYESQAIREELHGNGFAETGDAAAADVLVLNSCALTRRAVASCRNAARKALRANPGVRLVVTGCAVDTGEAWPAEIAGHIRVGNARKHALAEILASSLENRPPPEAADDRIGLFISGFHGRTRAFLKIQDGCDNHCAYCIVPAARGAPQSRPPGDILREAGRLVAAGHPEVVLTGINIGAYAHRGMTLAGLILRLAETPGLERLRLGSIEPPAVTAALVSSISGHERICPHIHLPLQSGDAAILASMRRRYTPRDYLKTVDLIRSRLDNPAITTDVIVGFPGEDAAAFANTYELCRRASFSRLHVFPFSPRPGTTAAGLRRTTGSRELRARRDCLMELDESQAGQYAASCVGMEERAVAESDGCLTDRYLRADLADGNPDPGTVLRIRIRAANGRGLVAEKC